MEVTKEGKKEDRKTREVDAEEGRSRQVGRDASRKTRKEHTKVGRKEGRKGKIEKREGGECM